MTTKVNLDSTLIKYATILACEVEQSFTIRRTKNYTGVTPKDRYLVGYIGELALVRLLRRMEIRFVFEPRTEGVGDAGDLTVYRDGTPLVIDAKTAGEPYHKCLLIFLRQYRRLLTKPIDVFCAMRLDRDNNEAEFMGACFKADLSNLCTLRSPDDSMRPRVLAPSLMLEFAKLPVSSESFLGSLDKKV